MKHDRISIDPDVMAGKPCIKGTRIPVDLVLRKLGAGETVDDLLTAYPHLTSADIRAAFMFTADWLSDGDIVLSESQ